MKTELTLKELHEFAAKLADIGDIEVVDEESQRLAAFKADLDREVAQEIKEKGASK